jgi:hypothetical protein
MALLTFLNVCQNFEFFLQELDFGSVNSGHLKVVDHKYPFVKVFYS